MFEISDDASQLMLGCLERALEGRPELRRSSAKAGLRLHFTHGAAYLSLAFPRPNDRVMNIMGRPVLLIDQTDLTRLQDTCLMVQHGPEGATLSVVPRTADPAS